MKRFLTVVTLSAVFTLLVLLPALALAQTPAVDDLKAKATAHTAALNATRTEAVQMLQALDAKVNALQADVAALKTWRNRSWPSKARSPPPWPPRPTRPT